MDKDDFYTILLFIDGIVAKMRSKAGPTHRVLQNLAEYEKFLDFDGYSIIGMLFSLYHFTVVIIIIYLNRLFRK